MTNVASISSEEMSELRRDFDRLKSDLQSIRTDFSDLGGDAIRAAKSGAAHARHKFDETMKAAGEQGKKSVEAIEQQVAQHPYLSLAAALVVGMVVGFGLTRRG